MDHIETGGAARYGRSMRPVAVGDTVDELELSALDKARAAFPPNVRLEIVPDYEIYTVPGDGGFSSFPGVLESGKTYYSHITVREVIA
ncbi:hypothetical protein FAF44_02970 [Nonomuraea sp. MG754425]|uniref:hypothetical protein n=1 Tax=Nonomuraea sp. MG754425 TaxID=2570319 RepID=UPI001F26C81C|nr:hypothetical protein [Nonomuraea sp. MG754425]MCF6467377.1 hypothetical protein [Nonomuraea sp. MG754425]